MNAMEDSKGLLYKRLCVLLETEDGKILQVAMNQAMSDCLFFDLKNNYHNGTLKVLPQEIHGIELYIEGESKFCQCVKDISDGADANGNCVHCGKKHNHDEK